jgi:glutamate-1-semialdehyde 2,1-aminomutase
MNCAAFSPRLAAWINSLGSSFSFERQPAMYAALFSTGRALMEGLEGLARKHESEVLLQGPGPVFAVTFTRADEITDYRSQVANADAEKYARFCEGMLERGVRLIGRGVWFVSTEHSDADVQRTLDVAEEVFSTL